VHIAIDAHSVGANLGGNETYATNLIEALAEIDQTNQYTIYVTKQSAIERFANRWPNFKIKQTLPHTPLVRIPITLSAELRKNPVDVLHVQYTAPPLAPCPVVATIHDLSFEHLPETFNRRSRAQLRLTVRHTARRAARILTLSEFSRRDISETYEIDLDRIAVTPAAASPHFARITSETELEGVREKYKIQRDYVLSLSSIQPRKNLVRLIEAYSYLRESHSTGELPQLVLAGKKGWLESDVFRAANQSRVARDILFTGYVADADLPALYSGALCFVYPSYFEGFGLPVVEAMQCGTPVIVGNRTSLPEVVGDAGILIDPFNHKDLADAMAHLLSNPGARDELRELGIERAKTFNWLETARLTLQVYEQVVRKS
jgi:glycosyltransferase involved in cell wall biosynthesis